MAGNRVPQLLCFAEFELDEAKRELRRQGASVPIQPKVFDLLSYLVRNRDRVVSREELLERLWPDEFVTHLSVTTCLRKARKALHPHGETLLKTFHRQGIRFVGMCCPPAAPPATVSLPLEAIREVGRIPPQILGRERELSILQTGLDQAVNARGGVILLTGPQGIGKSTLINALSERSKAAGALQIVGAGYEGEGAPSFWPWIEVLRAAWTARGGDVSGALSLDTTTALATLVPEIQPDSTPSAIPGDAAQVRFRLYDAIARFLRVAAAASPLVVVIEDIHWADAVSVALLRFIAHQIGTSRLLVVATLRESAEIPSEAVQAEITRLSSDVTVQSIKLSGLSLECTTDLVERLVPDPLPTGLCESIRRASGGIPLFVEQLATHIRESTAGSSDRATALTEAIAIVPEASAGIIARNLAKLSPATLDALALAAVLGSEFDLENVARLSCLESPASLEAARAAARAAMREARKARIVTTDERKPDTYQFAHGLFRNTVYQGIDSDRRSRLHWLAGTDGERQLKQGDGESSEIAEHFVLGVSHGSPAKAVEFCLRAADLARQRTDFTRASALLQHADRLTRNDESQSIKRRTEILIALAETLANAGKSPRAREIAGRAMALARRARCSTLFARAALAPGKALHPRADIDRERIAALAQSLEELPRQEVGLRVRTLRLLAWEHFYENDRGQLRSRYSQEAVSLARSSGTPQDLMEALEGQVETLAAPDQFEERSEVTAEWAVLANRVGDPEACSRAMDYQAYAHLVSGNLDKANAVRLESNRVGSLAHSPHSLVRAELWNCLISTLQGEWTIAEGHISKAIDLAQFIDEELSETIPWNRSLSAFLRGLIPPKAIENAITRIPGRPEFSLFLLISLLQAGKQERARATIESRFPGGVDDFPRDGRWLPLATHFGIACARIGNRALCADTYEKLLAYDGRHLVFGSRGSASYFGSVGWGLGVLAAALSRWTEADAHLEKAAAEFRRMKARPFLAMALCDHAEMLRRQGRARDQLRIESFAAEARKHADALPLEIVRRRLDALL